MTKHVKLLFALLAALAMLLLWSGPASATDLTETVEGAVAAITGTAVPTPTGTPITEGEDASSSSPATTTSEPSPTTTGTAPTTSESAPTTTQGAPTTSETAPTTTGPAPTSSDPAGPEGTDPTAAPSDDLDAFCAEVIGQLEANGLPADLDCGALADCFSQALPDGLALEDLAGLSEDEALAVLDDLDFEVLAACIKDVVPTAGEGGTEGDTTSGVYFENCDDARAQGAAPVYRGEPGYRSGLDRDGDGIGCEDTEGSAGSGGQSEGGQPVPVEHVAAGSSTTGDGQLAYTGVELTPVLTGAAALVVLGSGLLLSTRRRRG